MTMTPRLRKFMLAAHVTSSVGLLGAIVAFLALAIAGLAARDVQLVRASYLAMNFVAEAVILPLMLAALLIGIAQSLGTPWGLFRHYWVLAKLLLTVFATVVLLFQMDAIGRLAGEAALATLSEVDLGLQLRLVVHAAGGLVVLLVPVALSLYKPWGVTRYGMRKHQQLATLET